jgi:hypothetical protein
LPLSDCSSSGNFFASINGWRGCLITNTAVELAPHNPQAAKVQADVVRLEEALYRYAPS